MKEPLKLLDLFSGIGGFSLGLERTGGFKTVAFCEINTFAQRVLAKHWPGVPCYDDVETYDFQEGCADVISAGFPCQDISFAGAGAGLSGERSGLYRHVIRALRLVRPKFAILENVAALLSRGLGTVLGDMAEIGFDAEWHCIPASAVGAPHRRDRIWIIANPGSEQHEGGSAPISAEIASELSQAYLADAPSERCGETRELRHDEPEEWFACGAEALADAMRIDEQRELSSGIDPQEWEISGERSARPRRNGFGWWSTEPAVCRVASGVPARVDRLRALGNTVVPQVVECLGNAILAAMESRA